MNRCLFACCLFLFYSLGGLAQAADNLPDSPAYKGEIRRSADGRLIVVEPDKQENATPPVRKAATLLVGPSEKIRTISEAARVARDGEIIEIQPGEYPGQTAVWTQHNLTIRGGADRPVLTANGKNAEGKGLWVIRGGKVHVENLEFRGARVPDGNGAAIRFERGDLTIQRCAFADNEMGILTANRPEMTLTIRDSEFSDAPRHAGDLHHLLYVGQIGRFTLTGSRFANGYRGHLVKSRARENHVRYNLLADGPAGHASYELEFPNGGMAFVIGNVIAQSATSDNPTLVSYGAEGPHWQDNALYFTHNTLVNDQHVGTFLKVWSENFPGGIETWVINNLTVGNGDLFPPVQGRFEGNVSDQRRDLIEYDGIPMRLKTDSPLRGRVRIPGRVRDVDLLPSAEFVPPAGQRSVPAGSALAPGAFR